MFSTPGDYYNRAKLISQTFCGFPTHLDSSLEADKEVSILFKKLADPAATRDETRACLNKLKKMTLDLLNVCLSLDEGYAPAYFLYCNVAGLKVSGDERPAIILICEAFRRRIETVQPNTRGYLLVQEELKTIMSKYSNMVECKISDFYSDLGALYIKERRFSEAINCLKRAVEIMPYFPHLYYNLCLTYVENREYEKALSLWKIVRNESYVDFDNIYVNREDYCNKLLAEINIWVERRKTTDQCRENILAILKDNPGFLQSELKGIICDIDKNLIGSAVWELVGEGYIRKEKRGRSFNLFIK